VERLLTEIKNEDVLAIDTEFHREGAYFPKVALIQIAWAEHNVALLDPLSCNLAPLSELFENEIKFIMHAGAQDIEVFSRVCGSFPKKIFDTQIAAGFLGLSSPSLAILHQQYLGINLPKEDRMTDWLSRPLTESQKSYAASDVKYLLEIYDFQINRLNQLGRISWVEDECESFLDRESVRRSPDEAWKRIKELKRLKGKSRDAARSISRWRELEAARLDIPVRRVMSDLAIISISQQLPKSIKELEKVRGLEKQKIRNGNAEAILDAIVKAPATPKESKNEEVKSKNSDLRAAVALVTAYIYQLARDVELDPSLLGTRNDIEALISGDMNSKLAKGWRGEVVGEVIKKILTGKVSLVFDGDNRILLEPRN
jgi:ribonuclease D